MRRGKFYGADTKGTSGCKQGQSAQAGINSVKGTSRIDWMEPDTKRCKQVQRA